MSSTETIILILLMILFIISASVILVKSISDLIITTNNRDKELLNELIMIISDTIDAETYVYDNHLSEDDKKSCNKIEYIISETNKNVSRLLSKDCQRVIKKFYGNDKLWIIVTILAYANRQVIMDDSDKKDSCMTHLNG